MKTLREIALIASMFAVPFSVFSQQDTLNRDSVPESIKKSIEFPDDDLQDDKIPIRVINEKESDLLRDMYSANLLEIRLAEQAKTKAQSEELIEFAELMSKDHSAMNEQLHVIADKKSIVLPDTLISEKQEIVNKLIKETGKDYDMQYLVVMVAKHQDAVEMSEKAAKSCKDPEIRQWFEDVLPKLRHHLDKANNLLRSTSPIVD